MHDQDEMSGAMWRWWDERGDGSADITDAWVKCRATGYAPRHFGRILDQPGDKHLGIEVGRYYAVDTGWTAFRVDGIDTLRNTVDVTYHPSGSIGHWPISRLVEVDKVTPWKCPTCKQHDFTDQNKQPTCRSCGWSPNDIELPEEEIPMAQETLYRLLDEKKETYCTRLSTDSRGRAVVEIKGSGEIRAVEPKSLEEVLPYTVGIKFLSDGNGGQVYNYFANEGEFEVGDLLINRERSLAEVIKVNTKSRRANKRFKGWKVAATKIAEGEDEAE